MAILTGTPETLTEHSEKLGALNVMAAMGIPAALTLVALSIEGWTAISWIAAILWGSAAALVMWVFLAVAKVIGWTQMDLSDLLGSTLSQPHQPHTRIIGVMSQAGHGATLAVGWAYTMELFDWPANGLTGLFWGACLAALALLLLSSLGTVHPKIRKGSQHDPGFLGFNFGVLTPILVISAHLLYGLVLGLLYAWFPIT